MALALFHDLETKIREARTPAPADASPLFESVPRDDVNLAKELGQAREKAAVVAWFTPKMLVEQGGRAFRERVLSGLVPDCDDRPSRSGYEWCLRRDPRRAVLTDLAKDRHRLTRVLRKTERLSDDVDAQLLRRVLRGERVKADARSALTEEESGALLRVAEWTDGIFPKAPKPAEVQGLLARNAITQSLSILAGKFRGREDELDTLQRFILRPAPKHITTPARVPVLAVSGIGGVGKSALLSRFTSSLLERPKARRPTLVLIDFDRARFSAGDPVALTFELTRQIGAWIPSLAAELRELRHSARTNLLSSGFASQTHAEIAVLESSVRSRDELMYRLPSILGKAGVGTRTQLVIVFDTFEVVQGSRAQTVQDDVGVRGVHAVAEWINDLFIIGRLSRLKVVVAGRAPIAEDAVFGPVLTEPELRLTGIDRKAALEILRDHGLKRSDARTLVEALADPKDGSSNPLILRLAARLVKAGTVRPSLLRRDVGRARKVMDQELVQGILYRRILAHIGDRDKDKTLSALAHPGLVLRRVTPDIIKRVLLPLVVPAERRRGVDPDALFGRLRREVWLVRDTGPQTVEHRSDLRRTMLRLIDAEMRRQAVRIHRAAIKYYRSGGEPGLNPEVAQAEAYYHTLMLTTRTRAARLNPIDVRRFESALLPSLDDLPPHVLAIVKSILDRPLTDKEGLALPEPQRTDFIMRQGERCVRNDEPYRALELLRGTNLHPYWELQALASTVAWNVAKERGLLVPPTEPPSAVPTAGELYDRANLATWMAFCIGDSQTAYSLAEHVLSGVGAKVDWKTIDVRLLEQLARRVNYRTVAARDAGRPEMPERRIPWSQLNAEHLSSTSMALEATRQAVLGFGDTNWSYRVVFSGEMLPPSWRMLEKLSSPSLPPDVRRRLNAIVKRLKAQRRKMSSGEILGEIARGFPKAVSVDSVVWPELKEHWPLVCSNPEFRGPVKYALLDTFKTEPGLSIMAEAGSALLDPLPRELEPKLFVRTALRHNSPGTEVAKLVLFLDRSAALGRFLQLMLEQKPKAVKLQMVTRAFERWQRAFMPRKGPQRTQAMSPWLAPPVTASARVDVQR